MSFWSHVANHFRKRDQRIQVRKERSWEQTDALAPVLRDSQSVLFTEWGGRGRVNELCFRHWDCMRHHWEQWFSGFIGISDLNFPDSLWWTVEFIYIRPKLCQATRFIEKWETIIQRCINVVITVSVTTGKWRKRFSILCFSLNATSCHNGTLGNFTAQN